MAETAEKIAEKIAQEVGGWPGVSVRGHRFGGTEFRVNGHEIGHLHGDRLADLPFPRRVREQLVAAGRARPHHIYPASGWVSYPIRGGDDIPAIVALFRLSYERWTTPPAERVLETPEPVCQ